MKNNIVILLITIIISTPINAMEPETPCLFLNMPADIMNLIASFLTFDDVETEEEFIAREKTTSQYQPENLFSAKDFTEEIKDEKIRKPVMWLKKHKTYMDKNITNHNIYFIVYSPDNKICAMTYGDCCFDGAYYLSVIDIKTEKELHNVCLRNNNPNKYYQHLAVSSCGNIFATCYTNNKTGEYHKPYAKITNLHTKTKEYLNDYLSTTYDSTVLAFNKQGTHLIMHHEKYAVITPLTVTLQERELPTKTLNRYFAEKGICKNFMLQLQNGSTL